MGRRPAVKYRDLPSGKVWDHPVPTEAEVLELPVSVPFAHIARALGYGQDQAYRIRGTEAWPQGIPLDKIGNGYRGKRADLLAHLRIRQDAPDAPALAAAGDVSR